MESAVVGRIVCEIPKLHVKKVFVEIRGLWTEVEKQAEVFHQHRVLINFTRTLLRAEEKAAPLRVYRAFGYLGVFTAGL